jgi:hypothetical protein
MGEAWETSDKVILSPPQARVWQVFLTALPFSCLSLSRSRGNNCSELYVKDAVLNGQNVETFNGRLGGK